MDIIKTSNNEEIFVSDCDYNELNKYKWNINKDGYAIAYINGKKWRMHRYIMIELMKNDIEWFVKIDHINNNRINNKRCNLRIVTNEENARNRLKNKNASSNYYGVSKISSNNTWRAQLCLNIKLNAYYENEIDAAWQYNLWIKEYKVSYAKLNDIKEPENFKLYVKKTKKDNLPKGIYLNKIGKYQVQIYFNKKLTHYGFFDNLNDAKNKLNKVTINKNETILCNPVKNQYDQFIIELFNKKKEKVCETIIDELLYKDLTKFKWHLNKSGYVIGKVENKDIYLHRYIMNYYGINYIDHINNNKLDNRKDNLRIVIPKQKTLNK